MNCKKFEENIDAYIDSVVDGELTDSTKEYESHLETCDSCKRLYEDSLEIKTLLNDLEAVELPDDFEETLHAKLLEANVIPFYKKSIVKKLGFVSSIAAVGVIAFMSGLQMQGDFDEDVAGNDSSYGVMRSANEMNADMESTTNIYTTALEEDMVVEAKGTVMDDAEDGENFDEPPLLAVQPTLGNSVSIQFNESIFDEGIDIYYYQVNKDTNYNDLIIFIDKYEISNFDISNKKIISFNIEYVYYEELIDQLSEVVEIFQEVNVDISQGEVSSLVKIVIEFKEE